MDEVGQLEHPLWIHGQQTTSAVGYLLVITLEVTGTLKTSLMTA